MPADTNPHTAHLKVAVLDRQVSQVLYFYTFITIMLRSHMAQCDYCGSLPVSYEPLKLLQEPPSIHASLAEFPELRVSTITPASARLLKASVDWQDIAPPKSAAFTTMQVPQPLKSTFKNTPVKLLMELFHKYFVS